MKVVTVLMAQLAIAPVAAVAQSVAPVPFTADNPNATIEGEILGAFYADYVLPGVAGKTLSLSLLPNGNAYFNLLAPGSTDEAIYNSSINGNDAAILLESDGDYTIRVYLMGEDADAEKIVSFLLFVGLY